VAYRTVDIARSCGIHPNTVRFYERIGFLSPVPRDHRGYRVFTDRHLLQIRAIRLLYAEEWPGPVVRRKATRIVAALRNWDLAAARGTLSEYLATIDVELANAREAVRLLGSWGGPAAGTRGSSAGHASGVREYTVEGAARELSVTRETIRNWERNALLEIPRRGPNRSRYLTGRELARLRIISVLRKSGHSIAVIHRALYRLRQDGVSEALATFEEPEDLEIYTAGDHFMAVLERTRENAVRLERLLDEAEALP
jgi:DNA-binding transcriptional MerR regulator